MKYQKEGHITERISKAVEQLGEEKTVKRDGGEVTVPNIEVRIGGLLSLERIAQDSTDYDKGRDHVRVMEILCAYVRENAPASEARDFPLPDWEPLPDDATEEARAAHEEWREARLGDPANPFPSQNARDWAQSLPGPRADIALALQIIGRRSPDQRLVEARWGPIAAPDADWVFDTPCPDLPEPEGDAPIGKKTLDAFKAALDTWKDRIDGYAGYRLDLRGTNLQGADLSGLTLSGALLSGARMEGATLKWARMEGAGLRKVRMEGADLFKARMEGSFPTRARAEGANLLMERMDGAVLFMARMEGADLRGAQMAQAWLESARMEGANLSVARMQGAFLTDARMQGAKLNGAQMERTELSDARMQMANLFEARMVGASLWQTRMQGAVLTSAQFNEATHLRFTSIRSAVMRQSDLSMLDLTQEQIDSAFGDASVTLPDGLTRPGHWPDWQLPIFGDHNFPDEWREWQADPAGYTPPPPPGD